VLRGLSPINGACVGPQTAHRASCSCWRRNPNCVGVSAEVLTQHRVECLEVVVVSRVVRWVSGAGLGELECLRSAVRAPGIRA
jgi:hypothetical protein